MDVGGKRDVLQELRDAFDHDHPDIHFGLYYSLLEWFNPLYLMDRNNTLLTRFYPVALAFCIVPLQL